MKLLVALPCLNEGQNLAGVLQAIPEQIKGVSQLTKLVIDDGSTDDSLQVARSQSVEVISMGYNQGVGRVFQRALVFCLEGGYDAMVNIDGDGQFDPQDIPKIIEPIQENQAEFVTASRFIKKEFMPEMPPIKAWGNRRVAALISRLSGKKFFDVSCGFRAYSREALLNLNLHGKFTYTQETFLDLSSKGLRIREVPVEVKYFADRKSRVANSILRYAVNASLIIFRAYRDYHPLKFFWFISLMSLFPAAVLGGIFAHHFLTTGIFSGYLWAGFSSGFLLIISLVFFIVGIVTDMLDRIRVNQERMLFLLKKQQNKAGSNGNKF